MKILVLYHTKTGHTLEAIHPFVEGIQSKGSSATLVLAKEFKSEMLSDCDAFVVGTPCWGGSSGLKGVASPIAKILKTLPADILKDKLCGGIAVHALYGGAATLTHLERLLRKKGCTDFRRAPVAKAGVLTSIIKGKSVSKMDENLIRYFANKFNK